MHRTVTHAFVVTFVAHKVKQMNLTVTKTVKKGIKSVEGTTGIVSISHVGLIIEE